MKNKMKKQKYIIRYNNNELFYGEIARRRGAEAELKNARYIYSDLARKPHRLVRGEQPELTPVELLGY